MPELTRKVGDKVYIAGYGASRDSFYLGEVVKVTPKGNVTVKFAGASAKRFNSYGAEIGGDKYWGSRLDTEMSVQERSVWVTRQNRLKQVVKAISAITPEPHVNASWGKHGLGKEIARLEVLLNAAKEKFNAIDEETPDAKN